MVNEDKMKALDAAISNIEKQFGKGSVKKLGFITSAHTAGLSAFKQDTSILFHFHFPSLYHEIRTPGNLSLFSNIQV